MLVDAACHYISSIARFISDPGIFYHYTSAFETRLSSQCLKCNSFYHLNHSASNPINTSQQSIVLTTLYMGIFVKQTLAYKLPTSWHQNSWQTKLLYTTLVIPAFSTQLLSYRFLRTNILPDRIYAIKLLSDNLFSFELMSYKLL